MHKRSDAQFYEAFGRLVSQRRQEVALSQAEVATALELTRASLSNVEAGRQRPLFHQVVRLAEILEVDLAALVPSVGESDIDPDQYRLNELRDRVLGAAQGSA